MVSATPGAAADLAAVRAALAAGASPAAALGQLEDGPLASTARALRLGQPLSDLARGARSGDAHADLLVRALAIVERTGAGGVDAVDQVSRSAAEQARLERLLRVKTAQARGTARMLAALPLAVFGLFALVEPGLLGYYATRLGWATGAGAGLLLLAGHRWSAGIVARASRAAAAADPLTPGPPRRDVRRGLWAAAPAAVVGALGGGAVTGAVVGAAVWLLASRSRPGPAGGLDGAPDAPEHASAGGAVDARRAVVGGTAETAELVAVALRAGLPASEALAVVAPMAPAAAGAILGRAATRLRNGWTAQDALAGTPLAALGIALTTSERWGAPAHTSLEALAADVREELRAAAEEAAERTQLVLIFPTTLLTLPAFVLAIVPPMVWSALGELGGSA